MTDLACFGTTELALQGWLAEDGIGVDQGEKSPSWTMAWHSLFATVPTTGEFTFDFLLSDHAYGVRVVTPPERDIDDLGAGQWVTLRGHFNDPAASACSFVDPEAAADPNADAECGRLFVATAIEELDRPAPVCPTESPIDLPSFLAADLRCSFGLPVRITGWEDVGEGFGGVSTVYPLSLDPSMRLADAQLVSHRWESDLDHDPIFPWTIGGSGIRFDRSDTRVVVTGMLGHEVADGCRPGLYPSWTWKPPVTWAQNRCQHLFVITDVRVRS